MKSNIVDIKSAKERIERKKYAALVLGISDKMDHEDNKKIQEKRAEVERKARNKQ